MTVVKICGITRLEDAEVAVALGANALGFVLWPASPRHTTLAATGEIIRRLPPFITPVGVMVNASVDAIARAADAGLRLAQLHGSVPAGPVRLPVLRAVHLSAHGGDAIDPDVDDDTVLLDANDPVRHGGTGQPVDWTRARGVAAKRRVVLAGGLTPENVRAAILAVRPYAVDVASGVESTPGVKDHELLRQFMAAAKETV